MRDEEGNPCSSRIVGAPAGPASSGSSYLPADQLTAWGQGIAQVARQLAG
jgi:hypothetical protein